MGMCQPVGASQRYHRVIPDAVVARMAARKGATIASLAAEFGYDDETTRRALARRAATPTAPSLAHVPRITCPAPCRALLVDEAKRLGDEPATLAAKLLAAVLRDGLVDALLDTRGLAE